MLLSRKYSIFRYPQATPSEPTASSDIIQKSAGGYVPRIRTNGARLQPRKRGPDIKTHFYRTGCLCPSPVAWALFPRRTPTQVPRPKPLNRCQNPSSRTRRALRPARHRAQVQFYRVSRCKPASPGPNAHRNPPKYPILAPVRATWVTGLFRVISPKSQ